MFLLLLAPDAGAATQQLNPLQKLLGGSGFMTPMLLIFGIFYFLMIRPQQKKQREHDDWQKRVTTGDEVVTSGGIVGKITSAQEDTVTIEAGDKVRLKILRTAITGPAPGAKAEKSGDKKPDDKKAS